MAAVSDLRVCRTCGDLFHCPPCHARRNKAHCSVECLRASKTKEERFWQKVDKNGPIPKHMPHLGKCWIWIAAKLKAGYGVMGKQLFNERLTHRISYGIHYETPPKHLVVLHKCDNPSCIRPTHLFLGTMKDDVDDMDKKGRRGIVFGEAAKRSKLNDDKVRTIRTLWPQKTKQEIAAIIGVNYMTIHRVVTEQSWSHVR